MTAKTCKNPDCEQPNPQPLDHFAVAKSSKDGRRGTCKDCRNKDFRARHAGPAGDAHRATARARYAGDPAKGQAAARAWYQSNRDRKAETQRAWREANPDKVRQYDADRRARQMNATTGPVDFEAARKARADCYLCGSALGSDIHVDHVVPLVRGGDHTMGNLLPTHPDCNWRKGNCLLSELSWYSGPLDPCG